MRSATYTLLSFLIIALINGLPFDADNGNSVQQKLLHRAESSCETWYKGQGDPNLLLAQTLAPPCSIPPTFPSRLIDGWSTDPGCDASKQPNTCGLHKGAHGCYRHAYGRTGPGAQSCYDKEGKWISDPWKGAGTLDAETPLGGLFQQIAHGLADVIPYNNCCTTGGLPQPYSCNLYFEKRPPGQCVEKPAF